ncbi:hypothetical protein QTO34_001105 [Cnephaeus nilssonii]|uniref:Uncharacterized protein n=1 Tax=Cnephaeus nilssonii TaxID=3371016 RepID=A0AA40HVY7_CNENI|nr:hypothetical protein QTO34_001105 [Eptesicus nilssonii]
MVSLRAGAKSELPIVEAEAMNYEGRPTPPEILQLKCGSWPVHISGQHLAAVVGDAESEDEEDVKLLGIGSKFPQKKIKLVAAEDDEDYDDDDDDDEDADLMLMILRMRKWEKSSSKEIHMRYSSQYHGGKILSCICGSILGALRGRRRLSDQGKATPPSHLCCCYCWQHKPRPALVT